MIKMCTSLEQSEKLLRLGLDPSTADMHYEDCIETFKLHAYPSEYGYEYNIPAWSLTALLELMPLFNGTTPRLSWSNGSYSCFYYQGYSVCNPNSLVDAAFEMVCWLIEHGFIKVNK